jgi:sarcosine oxidase
VPDLGLPLEAHRVVNVTFEPLVRSRCEPSALPAFIISTGDAHDGLPSLHGIYGTPAVADQGVKVGTNGTLTDLDNVPRTVTESEISSLRELVEGMLPDAAGPVTSTLTCLYTKTPDEHFALGIHPSLPQVVVASPCSGHGFKFAPAIGSLLADLATGSPPSVDLEPFALHRFGRSDAQGAEDAHSRMRESARDS